MSSHIVMMAMDGVWTAEKAWMDTLGRTDRADRTDRIGRTGPRKPTTGWQQLFMYRSYSSRSCNVPLLRGKKINRRAGDGAVFRCFLATGQQNNGLFGVGSRRTNREPRGHTACSKTHASRKVLSVGRYIDRGPLGCWRGQLIGGMEAAGGLL